MHGSFISLELLTNIRGSIEGYYRPLQRLLQCLYKDPNFSGHKKLCLVLYCKVARFEESVSIYVVHISSIFFFCLILIYLCSMANICAEALIVEFSSF
jgi:hypothetical protein